MSEKYNQTFSLVMKLAKKRNEIAHEGALASKKGAADGLKIAKRVIRKLGRKLRVDLRLLGDSLK